MKLGRATLEAQVIAVALTALTLFVITVRPVTRPSGALYVRLGLTQMSLLTAPANHANTSRVLPATSKFFLLLPPLALVLTLILKTRRAAFPSVRLRRIRLPSKYRPADSPSSD